MKAVCAGSMAHAGITLCDEKILTCGTSYHVSTFLAKRGSMKDPLCTSLS